MSKATKNPAKPTSEASETDDLTGRTIDDFRILRELGHGGMGQVWLAEQCSLKRKVAVKILRDHVSANPVALQRFKQEAEAVAQITHPNIVQVYAFAESDGLMYMAMEFVEGWTLKHYMTKKGRIELPLALSLMRQIGSALQRASEQGIIHRDIKPENILLTRKGEAKVADFGLSRVTASEGPALNLTQSGVTMGTPLYMSPEQIEGKPVDTRSDLYSFGVTCYYMLSGQPPFTGETAFEVALAHLRKDPKPLRKLCPELPEPLCALVHKMMARDPEKRYQTCKAMLKELSKLREAISSSTAMMKSGEMVIERPPLDDLEEVTAPTTVPASSPTIPVAVQWSGGVLIGAVAAVVLLMTGVVVALGVVGFVWWKAPTAVVTPIDKPSSPDGTPLTREQTLRKEADKYLTSQSAERNPLVGFTACLELGLFYLDEGKLDEASDLFNKMDDIRKVESYYVLGRVGRGIVLALRGKAKESNDQFRDVFDQKTFTFPGIGRPKTGFGTGKRPDTYKDMLQDPDLRKWLAKAIQGNRKNGIRNEFMPKELLKYDDPTVKP